MVFKTEMGLVEGNGWGRTEWRRLHGSGNWAVPFLRCDKRISWGIGGPEQKLGERKAFMGAQGDSSVRVCLASTQRGGGEMRLGLSAGLASGWGC